MFLIRTIISFFRDEIYRELLITIILIVAVSTVFFHFSESWNWLDSLYFSISTITTTGYGDLYPKSDVGKIYNIFYLIVSLILILMFINTMTQHYNERKEKKAEKEQRHKRIVERVHENLHGKEHHED